MDKSKEFNDAISIRNGKVDSYLLNTGSEFKQKQIKELIGQDEEEDEDGLNWNSIPDKKDI